MNRQTRRLIILVVIGMIVCYSLNRLYWHAFHKGQAHQFNRDQNAVNEWQAHIFNEKGRMYQIMNQNVSSDI